MTVAVIILAWLLVNTWTTLIYVQAQGDFLNGWDDILTLAVCAVVSLPMMLLVAHIVHFIRKKIKKSA